MLASIAIFRPVSCFSSCSRIMPGQVSEISLVSCLIPMPGGFGAQAQVPYLASYLAQQRQKKCWMISPRRQLTIVLVLAWVSRVAVGNITLAIISSVGNGSVTDYASTITPDSAVYERCKATNRCNRAAAVYSIDEGRYRFQKQRFKNGRLENADLFLNFEDWKAGTMGLGVDHVSQRHRIPALVAPPPVTRGHC